MPVKDYRKLYRIQDKFLMLWSSLDLPFYLTGGTALGRFYLNHRYSEDLDFFVNDDPGFPGYISRINSILHKNLIIDDTGTVVTDDFARFLIQDGKLSLKVEFVKNNM